MNNNSVYEVECPDETTQELTAKIIVENIILQVDSKVQNYQVLA